MEQCTLSARELPDNQRHGRIGRHVGHSQSALGDHALRSDITMYCRRGYEDRQMNTTEFIWNASISKSILKGNLTFKLNAVDILAQLSNVRVYINAQARTETWRNTVPRYAMLRDLPLQPFTEKKQAIKTNTYGYLR